MREACPSQVLLIRIALLSIWTAVCVLSMPVQAANAAGPVAAGPVVEVGREVANVRPLRDGEEFQLPLPALLRQGERLLSANWTVQEGGGRPFLKGNGRDLVDPSSPLLFPRNFNRVSAPDANSCFGCHAQPYGVVGGGGDFVTSVFVLAQRFDAATFDALDAEPTRGTVDEAGVPTTLDNIGNSRATIGMFGSGFIEMLARQMSSDLQRIRDGLRPGTSAELVTKGIHFGVLARRANGTWDTGDVEGLPATSLSTEGGPPSLLVRPFHQAGAVVSLREFTINAMNQHHGIQATERFGTGTDADGDGFIDELSRADLTAATVYQATMAVPGRVIPRDPVIESAIRTGERLFGEIGCSECHVRRLPLDDEGWVFSEPNPFNPPGNLQVGEVETLRVDLTDQHLPSPRLRIQQGRVWVPAYTDLKLHDITSGPDDPNREPLDMLQKPGSPEFREGNSAFLTKKLWGAANEPPYFHHGKFTTLREAVLGHAGEALYSAQAYRALAAEQQDAVIEFLKSLQILPPGTQSRIVDENHHARRWYVPLED